MNRRAILSGLFAIALIGNVVLAGQSETAAKASEHASVLKEGTYTAKVAALACSACPPQVEKALGAVKGVRSVAVDAKAKTVQFTVEKGASVSEADIQVALKAAATEMGMGADYTLHDIKPVKT